MANIIKTKFSAVTAQPTSLAVGELAYSDSSDTLWIGDNTGTPVAIGGAAAFTKLAGIESGAEANTVDSVAGKTGVITLEISDITSLQSTLDGKAATSHSHIISDVTGLQSALDGKASTSHTHNISDVTGLQSELDGKVDDADLANYVQNTGGTLSGFLTLHADPTNNLHAATKQYVDSVALGLDFKASVRAASIADVSISTLNNGSSLDGVSLNTGDRVLLKDQSAPEQNGIYVVQSSGGGTRAPDADTSAEVTKGLFVYVESGTVNQGSAWVAVGAGNLGDDPVVLTQFGGGAVYSAGSGLALTGNVFSLDNHSAALITSGTLDDARLSANVILNSSTIDGGSF